jgi:hypothetical protein
LIGHAVAINFVELDLRTGYAGRPRAFKFMYEGAARPKLSLKRIVWMAEEVARAAAAERTCLLEMDRLMTSIRSLEGRLLLLHPGGLTVRSSQMCIGA